MRTWVSRAAKLAPLRGMRFPLKENNQLVTNPDGESVWLGPICFAPVQGYFRKGKVLLEMGQKSDALLQFHHCLALNPSFPAAQREMEKVSVPRGLSAKSQAPL